MFITSHIDFFSRTENLEEKVLTQNIIYVAAGIQKVSCSLKEWNLHNILQIAYEIGIIMSGVVNAGLICRFINV